MKTYGDDTGADEFEPREDEERGRLGSWKILVMVTRDARAADGSRTVSRT